MTFRLRHIGIPFAQGALLVTQLVGFAVGGAVFAYAPDSNPFAKAYASSDLTAKLDTAFVQSSIPFATFLWCFPFVIVMLASMVAGAAQRDDPTPSSELYRLQLRGGRTYEWDAEHGLGRLAPTAAPGDAGTVALPLFTLLDMRVARVYAALAFAGLWLGTPFIMSDGLDPIALVLYSAGCFGLLALMFYMDVVTIHSIRWARVRVIDGTAVLDDTEPREARMLAIPLFGPRRELGKLVWERLVGGVLGSHGHEGDPEGRRS